MTYRYIAIFSLLCALFLTISGSVHAVVFSLQPSIQTIQQGIPGPAIPGQQQRQEHQQPQQHQPQAMSQPSIPSSLPSTSSSTLSPTVIPGQQQSQEGSEGIIVHGIIDSLIFTPSATWIATGNWTIGVNNGNAALVTANMTWYNDNGTASHTHEILNFRPFAAGQEQQPIVVQPDSRSVSLKGTVDVGANHRIAWNGVQSTIDIKKGGKILSISLDDAQTNDHFGGRPIFGIVTSFTRCSDVPGPNMEMLQPCLNIPITPPAPQSAVTVPPSPAITNLVSPRPSAPLVTPANNTVHNPATSPPPPLILQSIAPSVSNAPGNMTTIKPPSTAPPRVSNATGKSPFDILGG